MTRKERIYSSLSQYCFMEKFFGDIIKQRAGIRGYTLGMLTTQLLDGELSHQDLKKFEDALRLSATKCEDFQLIFQERKLPSEDKAIDGEIINILAEVKASEFLNYHGFTDIVKTKRKRDARTADFTAKRNSQSYAVEVTRLGLAESGRKRPKLDILSKPPLFTVISSREPQNRNRIAEDIYDEVVSKHSQIKQFCQRQIGAWKGMLIISNGRDYFAAGRFENKLYELQPSTVAQVLEQVWKLLEEEGTYNYLHHIVITMGKDLRKAIVYPSLN